MTGAISAVLPSIASGTVFSTRRANSGMEAQSPFVGLMNFNIAAGQIYKAGECAADLAKNTKSIIGAKIMSAEQAIRAISKGDKALEYAGKAVQFIGDNVNPVICATGGIKVLCADDKESALLQESAGLGSMFLFEGAAKKFLGMSKFKRINGKNTAIPQEALYKDIKIVKNGVEKFQKFCNNTQVFGKSLKYLPSIGKGLAFVTASITGYKLGSFVGTSVAEKVRRYENKAKVVPINTPEYTKQNEGEQTAKTIELTPQISTSTSTSEQNAQTISMQNPFSQQRKSA